MKKNLIALAAGLCSICTVKAQTEKGSQTLGLNANYYHLSGTLGSADHSSIQQNKQDSYGIAPTYGRFIADNLELGITAGYSKSSQSNFDNLNSSYAQSQRGYYAGAFLNRYFLYEHKFGFRVGGALSYSNNKTSYSSITQIGSVFYGSTFTNTLTDTYTAATNLGLVYFPSPKMGLTLTFAGLYYSHNENAGTSNGGGRSDAVSFNAANNNLAVSVFYRFGDK